ncbi:MAG: hypothetical protein WD801_13335 [Gemmatimonadaceae bacterium]
MDAVLAAGPATPVQLAHACLRAGYDLVIPSSWGDELIAARALDRMQQADGPMVQCSCPLVASRLAPHGDSIASLLLCLVPPPVAAAEYLRALYAPARPRITFAGACAAGSHASVDNWLTPDELLASLVERDIAVTQQPTEFDSVLPPDRRRFYSEPGGAPSAHALRQGASAVELIETAGDDIVLEIAQHLLAKTRALVDPAVRLGCACAGVAAGVLPNAARARVREHEPPRARSPVVDHSIRVTLDAASPPRATDAATPAVSAPVRRPVTPDAMEPLAEALPVAVDAPPRRRSPTSMPRPVLGAAPVGRADSGRQLPRAYIARRRSSPRGVRRVGTGTGPTGSPRGTIAQRYWWVGIVAGVAIGLLISWLR